MTQRSKLHLAQTRRRALYAILVSSRSPEESSARIGMELLGLRTVRRISPSSARQERWLTRSGSVGLSLGLRINTKSCA